MSTWARRQMVPEAAIRFRDKVFAADYHVDAMKACIECPDFPESHATLEDILVSQKEPVEFGRLNRAGEFVPLPASESRVRQEWYCIEARNGSFWDGLWEMTAKP